MGLTRLHRPAIDLDADDAENAETNDIDMCARKVRGPHVVRTVSIGRHPLPLHDRGGTTKNGFAIIVCGCAYIT